jgi:hypothetical protein
MIFKAIHGIVIAWVDLLPPLLLDKSSGKVVLERSEIVKSCLKKYVVSYARDFGYNREKYAKSYDRGRIASQKSFFVRCKYLFSSDSVLVAPPRLYLRSSTLEQERNMAYVTEKEEDVS